MARYMDVPDLTWPCPICFKVLDYGHNVPLIRLHLRTAHVGEEVTLLTGAIAKYLDDTDNFDDFSIDYELEFVETAVKLISDGWKRERNAN